MLTLLYDIQIESLANAPQSRVTHHHRITAQTNNPRTNSPRPGKYPMPDIFGGKDGRMILFHTIS